MRNLTSLVLNLSNNKNYKKYSCLALSISCFVTLRVKISLKSTPLTIFKIKSRFYII